MGWDERLSSLVKEEGVRKVHAMPSNEDTGWLKS
jgi:hypothetical protein